jgi:hypothetical protein
VLAGVVAIALIFVRAAGNQASDFGGRHTRLSMRRLRHQNGLQRRVRMVAGPLASSQRQSCITGRHHSESVFPRLGTARGRSTVNRRSQVRMAYGRNSLGKPVVHRCAMARGYECQRCATSYPQRILRAWSSYRRIGGQTFLGTRRWSMIW